jgi:hypothetical protein
MSDDRFDYGEDRFMTMGCSTVAWSFVFGPIAATPAA